MNVLNRSGSTVICHALAGAGLMMAWQVSAKAARDSLFLAVYPASALPAIVGASAICSIVMSVLAARLLVRFGPSRVIPSGFYASALLHVVEWWFLPVYPRAISAFVYAHVVAIGAILLSGFWTLVSDRFTPQEARTRFGQIAAFGTLGSLAGGLLAERVAVLSSSSQLLLLLAILQAACFAVLLQLRSRDTGEGQREVFSFPEVVSDAPYLIRLAFFILLISMSAATLDYVFKVQAVASVGRGAALARFLALFYAVTAALTFVFQAGLTRWWLQRFGPGRTVGVLPAAVTGASVILLAFPAAAGVIATRLVELLLRGSLFRSGYELFFTPMPDAEKRSVKSVIDIGADRLGEGLAAAAIQLFLVVPIAYSSRALLGLTAVLSGLGVWCAVRLDRAYVSVLERGLASQSTATPEQMPDILTKSIVLQTLTDMHSGVRQPSTVRFPVADPVVNDLMELRSGSSTRVRAVLERSSWLDPSLVPQVIELLGSDETARTANEALSKVAGRITGQLVDCLADPAVDAKIRRRIPPILVSSDNRTAWDGLFNQLRDERFEIRVRCAKCLEKLHERHPEYGPDTAAVMALVGRELTASENVWLLQAGGEDQRSAKIDKVLRERISKNLDHIATLLALVLPRQSIKLAFRAMKTQDAKLRGVALEYLNSVLPKALAERLAERVQGPAKLKRAEPAADALNNLLNAQPSIMMRLQELRLESSPEEQPSPEES